MIEQFVINYALYSFHWATTTLCLFILFQFCFLDSPRTLFCCCCFFLLLILPWWYYYYHENDDVMIYDVR